MSIHTLFHLTVVGALAMTLSACGGGSSSTSSTDSTESGTSTAAVLCNYASSLFNSSPSVNATAKATWSCSSTLRSITANGLPDHAVGTFPSTDNPNAISAQNISASVAVAPTKTNVITPRVGAQNKPGMALNGIVFDPGTAGACDNSGACDLGRGTGAWSIEALGQNSFRFGTDSNNAHVQPQGTYHYHGIPEGLVTKLNKGVAMSMALIGWAADGFPIYARHGYSTASDASSAIKVVTSSYKLKTSPDANRPATSLYPMGAFTQDYEYVSGSGDLDECNGRTGVTPEFPNGIYHYYATDTFPYLQRCVKGQL